MHPQHVIVQEDDPFDLRCSFSHNVRCIWRQVALPWIVTRFELHHLLSECILNVAKTSLRDAGWWSCSGVNITNSTIYVESDFVMVLVIPKSPIGM